MSRNYKFHDPEGIYFISFATVFGIDVFVRRMYFDCMVENLNYCVDHKGMDIYAWCIMLGHVHLVFRSTIQKPELIRDLKSFTSKRLIALIEENQLESRREWLLNSFKKAAAVNSNNTKNQFWQQHNHPIQLWTEPVFKQKVDYTHR